LECALRQGIFNNRKEFHDLKGATKTPLSLQKKKAPKDDRIGKDLSRWSGDQDRKKKETEDKGCKCATFDEKENIKMRPE